MKMVPIGAFLLVMASIVSLVSHGQSARLMQQTWSRVSGVLPKRSIDEWTPAIPEHTHQICPILPLPLREKVGSRLWNAIELITLRMFLVRHIASAFLLPVFVGLAEGSWARSHQKSLVQLHSPIGFSAAIRGLELVPALIGLWVVAPIWISVTFLVWSVFALMVFSIRNLIVHAPTRL